MKVLFVCTGNVCRSPLAEGYLKCLLQRHNVKGIDVVSAGVAALSGAPPFECAQEVAIQHGFDISDTVARQLTHELIRDVDRIFCMETWQAAAIMQMDPDASRKVALLGSCHPSKRSLHQIPDPKDFTVPETLRTFQAIKESAEGYLESLLSQVKAD